MKPQGWQNAFNYFFFQHRNSERTMKMMSVIGAKPAWINSSHFLGVFIFPFMVSVVYYSARLCDE
jgi:hypothetical protein